MSLIISGEEFAGTEWIKDGRIPRRRKTAWWEPSDYQAKARHQDTTMLVGHWTAGEAGIKTTEDDGYRVVSAMQHRMSRKYPDQKLQVSVGFVIGACEPTTAFAPVWQTMDIGTTSGIHVGSRYINRRSIGVEIVSAGVPGRLNTRNRSQLTRAINGHTRKVVGFYPGQIRSWQRLALLLSTVPEQTSCEDLKAVAEALRSNNILIPRSVPYKNKAPLLNKMTKKEAYAWSGVLEHHHLYNTHKIDAANFCVDACLAVDFVGKEV
jgi:hypothetical protein